MAESAGQARVTLPQTVLELLGGRSVVATAEPVPGKSAVGVAERARKPPARGTAALRLRFEAVEHLGRALDESPARLMQLLQVNERTAHRRREQKVLSADESDRLTRIARVFLRAREAFGDEARAREWLKRSNRALAGERPLELLGSDAGSELVVAELGRIEFGELY